MDEEKEKDIYTRSYREELINDDGISPEEEGFMRGL